ncbi:NACHT domain-containing protein [Fortiea sp. LEGE XX443]|uniref:NACHT domain-containing protein n=1 Tax=Fortiea sp. LEGE XX443 TaxID=1828611 RepID=UPI001881F29B|nr:NACHT domain-containing protein [Fortiea sp. LEGE XX443]MBE9008249.1 NACHT domain-containing protein [Fortiea sp. LEGE XX443]
MPENTQPLESNQETPKDPAPEKSSASTEKPQQEDTLLQTKQVSLQRREARRNRVQKILKILGIPSSGFGIVVTINFIRSGRLTEAAITAFVTLSVFFLAISGNFIKDIINKVFDKIEEKIEQKSDKLADWIVNLMEAWVVSLWWQLTSPFQREYYQSLVYICRDYQTQGLDKDRILKLQKVFVPLKIVATDIAKAKSAMILNVNHDANSSKEKQIWDFLIAKDRDNKPLFPRIAVLGAPGTGKTTLLRYLTLTYANKQERKLNSKAPKLIPVLLYLRDVREEIVKNKPTLSELITQQIKQQRKIKPLEPPPNWFAEKLRENKCLVMLDGLDEVADETQRQQVSHWVDEQMQAYPDTVFIITSRPFGYKTAQLQQEVTVLEVQPFNLGQMQKFIHNWYLETEVMSRAGQEDLGVREEAKQQADDLIERIKNSPPLAAMAVNPLLLTMIATVHRRGSALPGKRVELYKEICQVLLERRQRAKDIPDSLTATQKQAVLQVLALELIRQDTRAFKLSNGITLTQKTLAAVAGNEYNPKDFIKQIRDISGLLVEKHLDVYEFAHLSFQEYLASVQIKEYNQEHLLIENINNSWWAETIRLYAAQSNASNLIRAVLDLPSPSVEVMALAYDCLEEGLSVDTEVREQLEKILDEGLESDDIDIRTLAAKVQLSRRLKNAVKN